MTADTFDDLPECEVSCAGVYFTPLPRGCTRELLTGWAHHEGEEYVRDALARMRAGEVFTSLPSGFQYRLRQAVSA